MENNKINNFKWKKVWEERTLWDVDLSNSKNVFMELKRCDGFDVLDNGVSYEGFYKQYCDMKKELEYGFTENNEFKSVFEVGCGSGANLYLFQQEGKVCGGIDYSESLIKIAHEILGDKMVECICDEAINLNTEFKYDVVISNSIFQYFSNYEYALKVLECMYDKCISNIAIIDIFDKSKEEQFHEFRRKTIPDYDKRYEGLDKLFYPKTFWLDFAEKNNLDIKFTHTNMEGYWNNEFTYSCYLYR